MSSTKPKWKEADAVKRGKEAYRLADKYREDIQPRLEGLEGVSIDGLKEDYELLDDSKIDRGVATTEKKSQTTEEREIAIKTKKWVIDIREMAQKTNTVKKEEKKSLGVGEDVNDKSTTKVVKAATSIFNALVKYPKLASQIGVIEKDLTQGRKLVADLQEADKAQAVLIGTGKDKTFDRNKVQLRVEAAVDAISSRGKRAFSEDEAVRQLFDNLTSKSGPTPTTDEPVSSETSAAPAVVDEGNPDD